MNRMSVHAKDGEMPAATMVIYGGFVTVNVRCGDTEVSFFINRREAEQSINALAIEVLEHLAGVKVEDVRFEKAQA